MARAGLARPVRIDGRRGSWLIAYHPRNRLTDLAARSRFTGEILVAASLALILVWSWLGLSGVMASPWAGGGDAFGRIDLWLCGALAGAAVPRARHVARLLDDQHTGVQTYLIALTAMPFFAIALEAAAAHLGWVTPPGLSAAEWVAAADHPGRRGLADGGPDESADRR